MTDTTDPTPEEVAAGRLLVGMLGELAGMLGELPLDVDQRRHLNAGLRHLEASRRLYDGLAAEVALGAAAAAGASAEHDT